MTKSIGNLRTGAPRRFAFFGVAMLVITLSLAAQVARADWQMVWNDEFEGNTLDAKKWDIEVNCWGGGNFEKQCYTSRPQNVFVSGGQLHLKPVRGTYQGTNAGCTLNNENSCTWTQPATSGRVRTLNAIDGSFKYGRFEARAKLPKGNFLWPAFWMLPTDNVYGTWAGSGEIDIMEFRGQRPTVTSSAIHYGGQWPNNRFLTSGEKQLPFDLTADFHVFALEWDETSLKFYVDSVHIWTQTLQTSFGAMYNKNGAPFDQRFHLLLNVAVAGGFFDPNIYGTFDINRDAATWSGDYAIDYVRVYKYVSGTAPTPVRAPVAAPVASPPTRPPTAPTPTPTPSPTPSPAGSMQIPLLPAASSYVDKSRPSTTFATEKSLRSGSYEERITYLKFFLPATDKAPTAASLSLYGSTEAGTSGNVDVSVLLLNSNSWTEESVTFENRPALCLSCPSWGVSLSSSPKWATFDVSSLINVARSKGHSVVSFAIILPSGSASFNSGRANTNKPMLNLLY